jgi:hypothetical protein
MYEGFEAVEISSDSLTFLQSLAGQTATGKFEFQTHIDTWGTMIAEKRPGFQRERRR